MDSSIYIFGNLGNGYTQFPNDYAQIIYQNFYERSKAQTQITVHRNENLIYYGYVRKLDFSSQYIGFCFLLNGVMFTQIGILFTIFENAITNLVSRGEILEFDDHGNIISKVKDLSDKQNEVERITDILQNEIANLNSNFIKLPPVNYGIANNECKSFSIDDNLKNIIEASSKYAYTYIYKNKDFDSASLKSYKSIIKRLQNDKSLALKEYDNLLQKYNKLVNQKKQYKKIVVLSLLFAACCIGLSYFYNSLVDTKSNLENARTEIKQKDARNKILEEEKSDLQFSFQSEKYEKEKIEKELAELRTSLSNLPIVITKVELANIYPDDSIETNFGETIYSNKSMYIKPRITYQGLKIGESISIDIKFYTPSGLSKGQSSHGNHSWTESFTVSGDSGMYPFVGWGGSSQGYWSSGEYRIEFWYNNVLLKSKTFTIY